MGAAAAKSEKPIGKRMVKGLKRALGLAPPKVKTKVAGTPFGPPAKSVTRIDQSLEQAVAVIAADGQTRIAVHGDGAFFARAQAALGAERSAIWFSSDLADQAQGAKPVSAAVLHEAAAEAVLVGGPDAALRFRQALRAMFAVDPARPVHWVAEGFEFCAGTLALPAEADDCDALLFNHFQQFFGQRDPLQFRIEAAYEDRVVRFWRILGPDQALNINIASLLPERRGPVSVKVHVAHPTLTRGRHYRLRLCADVFWKGSHTIVHGSHQFFKNPDKRQEFRLIDQVVRAGRAIMTVPNYDLDMGANASVDYALGAARQSIERRRDRRVTEVVFERPAAPANERRYYAIGYHGFGTSFWYAMEEGVPGPAGPVASIAGNHLCKVGMENRADVAMTAEEAREIATIEAAGFMIHPCAVPIRRGRDGLAFGFNYDASNPPFEDYEIRFFDGAGHELGRIDWRKDFAGPAFIDDILAGWQHEAAARAELALVAPAWSKLGLAPTRFVTTADLVVRSLATGDQDMTEFQSSWRNLGAVVPNLPHWLHASIGVIGRTNVIGRVRTKGGHRTGVLLTNASGNLGYRRRAEATLAALNLAGEALEARVQLSPFGAALVWLDEAMPGLGAHLGPEGIGPLVVTSGDADLCAQVLSVAPNGAVGLQHLWGY